MPTKLLVFLLVAKLSICDDPPASTQHVPYSCGQLKLTKVEKSCLWPFCDSYKLHFYDLTNTNETISSTANNIKCTICKHGEGECS